LTLSSTDFCAGGFVLRATGLRAIGFAATLAFGAAVFLDRFFATIFLEDLLFMGALAFAAFLGGVFFATALFALGRLV
jgi:hypothetical protein